MKRPSDPVFCHLCCVLDDVESQADGWKANQGVFRRATVGGRVWGGGYGNSPNIPGNKWGPMRVRGGSFRPNWTGKKFTECLGVLEHTPDLIVLCKENTPPILTAVEAQNICQSGHLIAFNRKYNVTLSVFSTWESNLLNHLL